MDKIRSGFQGKWNTREMKTFLCKQMEKHCSRSGAGVETVVGWYLYTACMVQNRILRHRSPGACTEFLKMQDF